MGLWPLNHKALAPESLRFLFLDLQCADGNAVMLLGNQQKPKLDKSKAYILLMGYLLSVIKF